MKIKISGAGKRRLKQIEEATDFFLFHLIPAYILKKLIVDIEIVDKCENDYLGLCISEDLKNDGDKSRKFKIFLKKRNLNIIRTLAHELVHLKQFSKGELGNERVASSKNYAPIVSTYWKGKYWKPGKLQDDYWDAPWEIEAHGKEVGLFKKWDDYLNMKKWGNVK